MAAELLVDQIQPNTTSTIQLVGTPTGFVIRSAAFRYDVRVAISATNLGILYGFRFKKTRTNSDLIATHTTFGDGYSAGNCGIGMRAYNLDTGISYWDYGSGYQYDGAWSATQQCTIVTGTAFWELLPAGTYAISVGWNTANGSTADRPFNYLNPDFSNGDGRVQRMVSSIFVYEVAP